MWANVFTLVLSSWEMYIVAVTLSLIIRKYTTNKIRVSNLIMRARAFQIWRALTR